MFKFSLYIFYGNIYMNLPVYMTFTAENFVDKNLEIDDSESQI